MTRGRVYPSALWIILPEKKASDAALPPRPFGPFLPLALPTAPHNPPFNPGARVAHRSGFKNA